LKPLNTSTHADLEKIRIEAEAVRDRIQALLEKTLARQAELQNRRQS
jgi:hypothetical protein